MVLVIIALGYFTAQRGWANETVQKFIPKLIINVTLPFTVISSFLNNLTQDTLQEAWIYFVAAMVSMALAYAISKVFVRAAKIDKSQRGVFSALFALSNSGYMGLPVAMAIFGEKGMLFALFYFAANSTFMNSVGYIGIERDGVAIAGETQKANVKQLLKQIFTPPLISIIAGLVLVVCGVTKSMLPSFLSMTMDMMGNITSPLALLFVGIVLHHTGLSSVRRIDKGLSLALIGRFFVSPLIMYLVCVLFGFSSYATGVLVVQTGLPAMVATTIFAAGSNADTDFAARGVVITTLLSFITIPLYIAILGM